MRRSIKLTLSQLSCCGVLEAAQISAGGFPNRLDYTAFLHSYAFTRPLFRRHSRQRFPTNQRKPPSPSVLAMRATNLRNRFPHAHADEVRKQRLQPRTGAVLSPDWSGPRARHTARLQPLTPHCAPPPLA